MKDKRINIALISTKGGHIEELSNLSGLYSRYNHFWVTNKNAQTVNMLMNERKYFVNLAHFKQPWTYLVQLPLFAWAFAREKPTHILSTGSGRTAFVPFILTKLLRIRFVYIDTFARVQGYSKFGAFLLRIGHQIFCQWPDHENQKAVYIGPIFKKPISCIKDTGSNYIFVTLGTSDRAFTRLIRSIEELKKEGTINEKVNVQAGSTKYTSEHLEVFDLCAPERIHELIMNARYVVTQESAGIVTICLKYQTPFLVMPRDYKIGELPSKNDEDLHFKLEEMGYTKVVNTVAELQDAVKQIDKLKTGFDFDNQLAIETLTRFIEESR